MIDLITISLLALIAGAFYLSFRTSTSPIERFWHNVKRPAVVWYTYTSRTGVRVVVKGDTAGLEAAAVAAGYTFTSVDSDGGISTIEIYKKRG